MPILFPFAPNWASAYKVESAYRTEIITSRAYKEQRLALMMQPRKSLSFTITPRRGGMSTFLGLVAARQQVEFVLPELTRIHTASITAAVGTDVIELVGSLPAWAVTGAYAVVEGSAGQELVQIISTVGSSLILTDVLAAEVPAGSRVYPGLVGRLDQGIRGTLQTNTTGNFTINFDADPGLNTYRADVAAPVTFNGRELFLTKPNWRSAPAITLDGLLETTDYGRGRKDHHEPTTFNRFGMRMEFVQRDATEAELISDFFHRMKGQQGEFYMPTWGDDFDLSIGAAAAATVLDVPGTGMFDYFAGSTVYKAAIAFYRDGTYQANVLNSITSVGGNSRFTFASPWTNALDDDTVKTMCWLPAWRLVIDTLTMDWLTRTVAQTQLTARAIEDLA